MRKTWVSMLLIFCLLLPAATLLTARAEDGSYLEFTVNTPTQDETYSTPPALNVTVDWLCANLYSITYSLDGQSRRSIPLGLDFKDFDTFFGVYHTWTDTLPQLNIGKHTVTVYIEGQWGYVQTARTQQKTINFTVHTIPPELSLISVQQNQTCNQPEVPINFTINKPAEWIGYSLDNTANVTINGNSTITPAAGTHSIVIYANDTAGNMGKSEAINFTVQPSLLSDNTFVIAIAVIILAAVLALTAFFFRRHSQRRKT